MFWEMRKSISIFSIVVVVLVALLCGRLLYRAADVGVNYGIEENDVYISRYFNGWELREINEKYVELFQGRVMDDNFFVDLNMYFVALSAPTNGKVDLFMLPYGTSLYKYYELFDKIDLYTQGGHMVGEIFTDVESTFGIDPPVLVYTDGWNTANDYIGMISQAITVGFVVLSASVFSKEYSTGMISLINVSKNGRTRTAINKCLSTLLLATAVYAVFLILCLIFIFAVWGADNPLAPVQILMSGGYITLTENISCIQLFLMRAFCCWLGLISAVMVTLAISSIFKKPYIAVAVSLLVYFLPYILNSGEEILDFWLYWPFNYIYAFAADWSQRASSLGLLAMYTLNAAVWCALGWLVCAIRMNGLNMKSLRQLNSRVIRQ